MYGGARSGLQGAMSYPLRDRPVLFSLASEMVNRKVVDYAIEPAAKILDWRVAAELIKESQERDLHQIFCFAGGPHDLVRVGK